jgi:hypothetical protein
LCGRESLRQLEDLAGQLDQLLVLVVFFLHHLPLQIRGGLPFEVGPVLADHHERRQEDRFQRHDHRQQAERIALDAEDDPDREPQNMEIDERHRARESRDDIRYPVLQIRGPRFSVPGKSRVDRLGQLRRQDPVVRQVYFGV